MCGCMVAGCVGHIQTLSLMLVNDNSSCAEIHATGETVYHPSILSNYCFLFSFLPYPFFILLETGLASFPRLTLNTGSKRSPTRASQLAGTTQVCCSTQLTVPTGQWFSTCAGDLSGGQTTLSQGSPKTIRKQRYL